jgi:RNA polymerase sigma-70 factor (ECF subfamily)
MLAAIPHQESETYALWHTIIAEHAPQLRGFFLKKPETRAVADDLVQDVFLAAWKARQRYQPDELSRVMVGIARNRWRQHCRSGLRRQRALDEYECRAISSCDPGGKDELNVELHSAIAQLPKRAAEVVRRRHLQGQSVKDVARDMQLSEAAVSCLLYRARQQLKRQLANVVR